MRLILVVLFLIISPFLFPTTSQTQICFETVFSSTIPAWSARKLHPAFVTLKVFDVLEREVATLVNEEMRPGRYERMFDGNGLASGVYMYKLRTGSFVQTKKLLLLR